MSLVDINSFIDLSSATSTTDVLIKVAPKLTIPLAKLAWTHMPQ